MSAKHSHTTADYIPFDTVCNLIRRLYKEGDYLMSMFFGMAFLGLRCSDILKLQWKNLLCEEKLTIVEQKTGKSRELMINRGFQEHAESCRKAMGVKDMSAFIFLNRFGNVITIQSLNRKLKQIKVKFNLKGNISTHAIRKSFGREIFNQATQKGECGEYALLKLAEIFGHSSPSITKRYLGIRQSEILNAYSMLQF